MDLNKALIIGRLTRDPESRTTPNGANVCSFSIATNYVYTSAAGQKVEQVEYHNIIAWRKLGEIAQQYLKKGSRVYIEGRIQTRSWDAKDGSKKNRTEIVLDNMIMLDSKGIGGSARSAKNEYSEAPSDDLISSADLPTVNQEQQPSDSEEITVEDIPF